MTTPNNNHQWPAPIAFADRNPTQEDANAQGYIQAFEPGRVCELILAGVGPHFEGDAANVNWTLCLSADEMCCFILRACGKWGERE